jgi:hypothetical protein
MKKEREREREIYIWTDRETYKKRERPVMREKKKDI